MNSSMAKGMKLCMDGTCMSRAENDIRAGRIHHGVFVPPSDDECVDGECLARTEDDKPAMPIYKDGKVSVSALHHSEQMAHEGGHTELASGARRLIEMCNGTSGYGMRMSREGAAALAISMDGEWVELSAARGLPKERNGKKCFYFDREILKPGKITLSNGETREVTPQYMDTVLDSYVQAKAHGIEPSLPEGHDKKGQNYGWIVGLNKDKANTLTMTMQVLGEKEKSEVLAKKPSVGIFPDVIDQYGNKYPLLLDHVAIVPDPQANNLDDTYYPLAASADRSQHIPMLLARYAPAGEAEMPISDLARNTARELSGKADLPDSEVADTLANLAKAATAKNLELSRTQNQTPPAPTKTELMLMSRAIRQEKDRAIVAGWTPAQLRKLEEKLLPTGVKLESMTLARNVEPTDHETYGRMEMLLSVVEALGSDRPAGLLYRDKGGVTALQRETPTNDRPNGAMSFDPYQPPPEGYQGMSLDRKNQLLVDGGFEPVRK